MRDDDMTEDAAQYPLWQVIAYPLSWIVAVFLAIFALGLGTAAGADEQAVSLVQSHVKAREQGNGALACSLLSPEQERELVAIQTRDYSHPDIARCPSLILATQPDSHLLNPELAAFAASSIEARYSPAGFAVITPNGGPSLALIVIFEHGHAMLDMRGAERLGFINGCGSTGAASSAECSCVFAGWRVDGLVETAFAGRVTRSMRLDESRCRPTGATGSAKPG